MIGYIKNQRIKRRTPLKERLKSNLSQNIESRCKEISGMFRLKKSSRNNKNKSNFFKKLVMPLFGFLVIMLLTFFTLGFSHGPSIDDINFSFEDHYFDTFLREELFEYNEEYNNTANHAFTVKTSTYKVKKGDTLGAIARKYNVKIDTIISFNTIENVRNIKVGKVLDIPNADGLKYRVRRGDSLSIIAKRYKISVNNLLDWNNLNTTVIKVGQVLFIPGAMLSENERNKVLGRLFIKPTRGVLTSPYGMRNDPITGAWLHHAGIDIANKPGTPIVAAMAGKVTRTGYEYRYGNFIIISHYDGFQTLYGHLDSFSVREGQNVAQGQKIGKMGNTGHSTGCHLHFGIFKNGDDINPALYVKY